MSVKGEERKKGRVLVLGMGNIFGGDDGIGSLLAEKLSSRFNQIEAVDVIVGGTAGLGLLYLFEEYTDVIILDAVDAGREPGEVLRFRVEELASGNFGEIVSSHQPGVTELFRLSRLCGKLPERVLVLAVQIKEITTACGLSEELQSKLPEVEKQVEGVILAYLKCMNFH